MGRPPVEGWARSRRSRRRANGLALLSPVPVAASLRAALAVLAIALAAAATAVADDGRYATNCASIASEPGYADGVYTALQERRDVWGDELLGSPAGPTYAGVRQRLHPLVLVGKPAGLVTARLTASGVS